MQQSDKCIPGLVVAGLRGGSGKTVISLGITAAWKKKHYQVAPFKKGPDYIDAGWLACAADRPCYNLDTYLCENKDVHASFVKNNHSSDISLVEGNRGLFDGIDTDGRTSTAELAKLLALPVLLVIDCTKTTRTVAALLKGCMLFDPGVRIMGVVLNRVAGKRHEKKLRDNIQKFCDIPVYGSIPKLGHQDFPERHMGLVTSEEHGCSTDSIETVARVAREHIDLEKLYEDCRSFSLDKSLFPVNEKPEAQPAPVSEDLWEKPVVGIIKDSAFQFYYPDNIEALVAAGAEIRYISPLKQKTIPRVDAIYMGGGFPETHAPELSANVEFKTALRKLADEGLPIYAECGGFIFLGDSICIDGREYAMAGILPVSFGFEKRPVGHGYTRVKVTGENPFYPLGHVIKGHEFRYSSVLKIDCSPGDMAFSMERGKGIKDKKDGFCRNNVFATYTHIHALGTPFWADSLVRRALAFKKEQVI
ncbi:MAG: cobyrinate a,c-diamide synthase [Desulfarculaceae bacterium]|nr:cobyrinate a,c-diamide synthase [Desulfarculaceae bacterium]